MAQSGVLKSIPYQPELHIPLLLPPDSMKTAYAMKTNNINMARQACRNKQKILCDQKEERFEQLKKLTIAISLAGRAAAIKIRAEIRHTIIAMEVFEKEIALLEHEIMVLDGLLQSSNHAASSGIKRTVRYQSFLCGHSDF
jgi:hypothetical protein